MIRINGVDIHPASADIVETEPGIYSVLAEGKSYEARVAGDEIAIGGVKLRFEIEDPRRWKRSAREADAHGRASIYAAMPGKIVRVLVSKGDEVTAGQGILVIEAMKMQNELKAPRAGRITNVEVKENDSVNAGALLALIE